MSSVASSVLARPTRWLGGLALAGPLPGGHAPTAAAGFRGVVSGRYSAAVGCAARALRHAAGSVFPAGTAPGAKLPTVVSAVFSLLDSTLTDQQLVEQSRAALASKVAVDVLTVRHLQQVAALCRPDQGTLLRQLLVQASGDGCAAPGGGNADCVMPLAQLLPLKK